jgi:hypothetical protein
MPTGTGRRRAAQCRGPISVNAPLSSRSDRHVTSQASPSVLVPEDTTSESLLACTPPMLSTDAPTANSAGDPPIVTCTTSQLLMRNTPTSV